MTKIIGTGYGEFQAECLRPISHLKVWTMVCPWFISFGFTLPFKDHAKDFCMTYVLPVVITYEGCIHLYLTLSGASDVGVI